MISFVNGIFFSILYLNYDKLENHDNYEKQNKENMDFILKSPITADLDYPIIADHRIANIVRLDQIPEAAIEHAKQNLHIAYQHTSHGSQIISGMNYLPNFKENNQGTVGLYAWNDGPLEGFLDIDDNFAGWGDLGHLGDLTWAEQTRKYLNDSNHADVNVIIWSWCGGVSDNTEEGINIYLNEMNSLENEYPDVLFVYMTGHADGSGIEGNLHIRNQQIRDYCIANNKILYDFYDIECYNPDGIYFGDKYMNDACAYDSDGDTYPDSNWAEEWQANHTKDVDWYECSPAHASTAHVMGNMKAYAAWWLFSVLAGWNSTTITTNTEATSTSTTSSDTSSSSSDSTNDTNNSENADTSDNLFDNKPALIGLGFTMGIFVLLGGVYSLIKKNW
ncbi:hypothetical protein [Candidatus Harpocratesius sp.]